MAEVATILNNMFERHQELWDIKEGDQKALNKSVKESKTRHTRPVTLLNMIRKILANIVLKRIEGCVEANVRASQIGYRKGRPGVQRRWYGPPNI